MEHKVSRSPAPWWSPSPTPWGPEGWGAALHPLQNWASSYFPHRCNRSQQTSHAALLSTVQNLPVWSPSWVKLASGSPSGSVPKALKSSMQLKANFIYSKRNKKGMFTRTEWRRLRRKQLASEDWRNTANTNMTDGFTHAQASPLWRNSTEPASATPQHTSSLIPTLFPEHSS